MLTITYESFRIDTASATQFKSEMEQIVAFAIFSIIIVQVSISHIELHISSSICVVFVSELKSSLLDC